MERLSLIEFPADDLSRAQRFWAGLLGIDLGERSPGREPACRRTPAAPSSVSTRVAPAPVTVSRCPISALTTWRRP